MTPVLTKYCRVCGLRRPLGTTTGGNPHDKRCINCWFSPEEQPTFVGMAFFARRDHPEIGFGQTVDIVADYSGLLAERHCDQFEEYGRVPRYPVTEADLAQFVRYRPKLPVVFR